MYVCYVNVEISCGIYRATEPQNHLIVGKGNDPDTRVLLGSARSSVGGGVGDRALVSLRLLCRGESQR